jgi:hypothetical protein
MHNDWFDGLGMVGEKLIHECDFSIFDGKAVLMFDQDRQDRGQISLYVDENATTFQSLIDGVVQVYSRSDHDQWGVYDESDVRQLIERSTASAVGVSGRTPVAPDLPQQIPQTGSPESKEAVGDRPVAGDE